MNTTTPYIFFTGKGGVGKTTMACATAVHLAEKGQKVLLVCTDPASNLSDVLQSEVDDKIRPVTGTDSLFAINIDPEIAAEEYRDRSVAPLKGILPEEQLNKIREELSGACTTEIASFDEFSRFVAADEEDTKGYDTVVFDTAPTGHTLRLLELPAAWSSFIDENPDGASCLGPTSSLKSSQERYLKVVEKLRDQETTTFYLVSRPQTSALKEAERSGKELNEMGLKNQKLLINGYFTPLEETDTVAVEMKRNADEAINQMPELLKNMEREDFPLRPYNILGIDKLKSVFEPISKDQFVEEYLSDPLSETESNLPDITALVDQLEMQGNGLIMTMGKGGVGKTSIAVAVALLLAKRGHPVHLTTTDPAAHITEALGEGVSYENLTVDQINPKDEKQAYIEKVLKQRGKKMDEESLKLLKEDLESPCTEEVAVFHAFSKVIQEAKRKFVVVDTAPTGHTLLLLDTAGSYHREILRNTKVDSDKLKTPYMYLQDKNHSRILLVTLPETTPVNEAAKLQEDLQRAGIEPYAWIINQSISNTEVSDPLLKTRAQAEVPIIQSIRKNHKENLFAVPWIGDGSIQHHVAQKTKSIL